MRVVVVGAGIAGLALARGLINSGHDVEVLERAPEMRTSGGSITLWPGSTNILREFKVEQPGRRLEVFETLSTAGKHVLTVDVTVAERRFGAPTVHVVRRDLIESLTDGVSVTYSAEVAGVDVDAAEVRLADGRTVRGDVLVGADGRRSKVSEAMWGPSPMRRTRWVTWQGFIEDRDRSSTAVQIVGKDGFFSFIPAGGGRMLVWFDLRSGPGKPLWRDQRDPVAALRARFGGWGGQVPEILASMTNIEFFSHYRRKIPSVWGKGPVTLLGESAHVMPPTLAQGANQSLEDAWALVEAINGGTSLRAYEQARAKGVRGPARLARAEFISALRQPSFIPGRIATKGMVNLIRSNSSYLRTHF